MTSCIWWQGFQKHYFDMKMCSSLYQQPVSSELSLQVSLNLPLCNIEIRKSYHAVLSRVSGWGTEEDAVSTSHHTQHDFDQMLYSLKHLP